MSGRREYDRLGRSATSTSVTAVGAATCDADVDAAANVAVVHVAADDVAAIDASAAAVVVAVDATADDDCFALTILVLVNTDFVVCEVKIFHSFSKCLKSKSVFIKQQCLEI